VDEEYVNAFARGVPAQGPHEFNFDDGSLVWPTAIAFDKDWRGEPWPELLATANSIAVLDIDMRSYARHIYLTLSG
jgi:hypothetical protein